MRLITCPHCGHRHVVASRVPKDVVVVMPCPACSDLIVMFRNKVVGLKRKIVEEGSFDEKKAHISEVIAHFLEPGMIWPEGMMTDASEQGLQDLSSYMNQHDEGDEPGDSALAPGEQAVDGGPPITQGEVDHFVTIDLQRIDDATYFRKYFS